MDTDTKSNGVGRRHRPLLSFC